MSEGGETESRGHLSMQVGRRRRPHESSLLGDCGWPSRQVSHCPQL